VQLYSHALESVFSFLSLSELSDMMAVSHSWSAAVLSMRRLGFTLDPRSVDLIRLMCHSRLSRHVSGLDHEGHAPMIVEDVSLVATRMPHLRELVCKVIPQPLPAGSQEL
jgi:hypothetical protein